MNPARRFIVVSGLPGSGKTTLARRLATALELPLLDKDDLLEALFASEGVGDTEWRRALSRRSDAELQRRAESSSGAVLVSFWQQPGMAADSGTPTGWLARLPGALVHVRCDCPPQVAALRFVSRRRHPGHLDALRSAAQLEDWLESLSRHGPIELAPVVPVETSRETALDAIVDAVVRAFERR